MGLRGDIGGFGVGTEFTWNIVGVAAYRAWDNVDILAGYRVLSYNIESGHGAGDLDLTPEVQLILTADHTPGHQAVFVRGAERVLIAGQVAESALEYAQSDSAVVQRLRRLEPDRVYFSHEAP